MKKNAEWWKINEFITGVEKNIYIYIEWKRTNRMVVSNRRIDDLRRWDKPSSCHFAKRINCENGISHRTRTNCRICCVGNKRARVRVCPSAVLHSMNEFIKLLYPLVWPRNPQSHDNNHKFDRWKKKKKKEGKGRGEIETILKSF